MRGDLKFLLYNPLTNCRCVLPRIGDATASTAATLAKPPRALETGEGSACRNHARETIPIFGDADERAGDATAATATMLTTLAGP